MPHSELTLLLWVVLSMWDPNERFLTTLPLAGTITDGNRKSAVDKIYRERTKYRTMIYNVEDNNDDYG